MGILLLPFKVPSILMEYFASDPRVVKQFARHYRTGAPMPDKLASNLEASRTIFQASETQLQVLSDSSLALREKHVKKENLALFRDIH